MFDQRMFLGFVNKVTTNIVTAHIPSSKYINKFFLHGEEFHGGLINNFVIIEGENIGFIGKIVSNEIPEKERLEFSAAALKEKDFHPLIKIEIQSIFNYSDMKFSKSISDYPNLGAKVYIARDEIIERYLDQIEIKRYKLKTTNFANLLNYKNQMVNVSFQSLFNRHTAIVGTTGSGKSWTTANLIENLVDKRQKVILLDATGEYINLAKKLDKVVKVNLGSDHHLNYKLLGIEDLFYLVKPSAHSQLPKLKEAIKSLKLLEIVEQEINDYIETITNDVKVVNKNNKPKEPFQRVALQNIHEISKDNLNFNILGLPIPN